VCRALSAVLQGVGRHSLGRSSLFSTVPRLFVWGDADKSQESTPPGKPTSGGNDGGTSSGGGASSGSDNPPPKGTGTKCCYLTYNGKPTPPESLSGYEGDAVLGSGPCPGQYADIQKSTDRDLEKQECGGGLLTQGYGCDEKPRGCKSGEYCLPALTNVSHYVRAKHFKTKKGTEYTYCYVFSSGTCDCKCQAAK
jgi:hypothetical protein